MGGGEKEVEEGGNLPEGLSNLHGSEAEERRDPDHQGQEENDSGLEGVKNSLKGLDSGADPEPERPESRSPTYLRSRVYTIDGGEEGDLTDLARDTLEVYGDNLSAEEYFECYTEARRILKEEGKITPKQLLDCFPDLD